MPSAIVLGGGIAGSAAGLALVQAGWQVRVSERAARLEAVGGALSLWSNAMAALARLDVVEVVRRSGMPFTTILVADRGGRPIIPPRRVDGEAMLVTRSDLLHALVDALPSDALVLGREVAGVEEHSSGALLHFSDGRTAQADLIVDAGGLRSVAAEPDAVSYRGYGGVVALSDPVDGDGLDGLAAEYWGWGERFGLFELTGKRRYWFYMRDQRAGADPPNYGEVAARAMRYLPIVSRAVGATPPGGLIPFSIHARTVPRDFGRGHVVRVGDAAHAMEPNLGQGACQALEDAVALGAAARTHAPNEIASVVARLRLKRVGYIVRRAAEGRHGAHGSLAKQWLARSLLQAMPSIVTDRVVQSIQTMPSYSAEATASARTRA
ncbi:FAD-dependent monooxygenase [Sphingomonas bacterium]|uniref:FAD-dependent monooxygenase n=1 Tax=Sphingomonas bacterium TaxID=1895847 RepID=UPI0015770F6B|nr:FAD-dependent monooxygenase [Sphingomonas bacterium]